MYGFLMALSPRQIKLIGLGLVAALGIALFVLWLRFVRTDAVQDYVAGVEAKAAPAREEAARQRSEDVIRDTQTEESLHHAIDASVPSSATADAVLSPAAHALACQRLRNLGREPAACRPQDGDGAQANSR